MSDVNANILTHYRAIKGSLLSVRLVVPGLVALLSITGCNSGDDSSKSAPISPAPVSTSAERGPVRATLTVSGAQANVAEKLNVRLEVRAEKDVELTLPLMGSDWEGWRVSDVQVDRGTSEKEDDQQLQALSFDIMALKTGEQKVPAVAVKFVDRRNQATAEPGAESEPNELTLEPVSVNITSVLEADADPTQYRDAKGLADIRVPKPWSFWAVAIALCVVALFSAGAALLYIRRNWQRSIRMAKVVPPHEWALQQIEILLTERLVEQGQFEPFYVRLSGIVRTYLEIRFGLMAPERTTEEFLHDAGRSPVLSSDHQGLLSRFLSACDMVKFARYRPEASEIQEAIESARNFVRETRPIAQQSDAVAKEAAA